MVLDEKLHRRFMQLEGVESEFGSGIQSIGNNIPN